MIVSSDGEVIGKEMKGIIERIDRKEQGSKNWKQLKHYLKTEINRWLKQFISGKFSPVLENLKNLKKNKKNIWAKAVNRKFNYWLYSYTLGINALEIVRARKLGLDGLFYLNDAATKALAMFGYMRGTGMLFATIVTGMLVKFGGYALTGLSEGIMGRVQSGVGQAAQTTLTPEAPGVAQRREAVSWSFTTAMVNGYEAREWMKMGAQEMAVKDAVGKMTTNEVVNKMGLQNYISGEVAYQAGNMRAQAETGNYYGENNIAQSRRLSLIRNISAGLALGTPQKAEMVGNVEGGRSVGEAKATLMLADSLGYTGSVSDKAAQLAEFIKRGAVLNSQEAAHLNQKLFGRTDGPFAAGMKLDFGMSGDGKYYFQGVTSDGNQLVELSGNKLITKMRATDADLGQGYKGVTGDLITEKDITTGATTTRFSGVISKDGETYQGTLVKDPQGNMVLVEGEKGDAFTSKDIQTIQNWNGAYAGIDFTGTGAEYSRKGNNVVIKANLTRDYLSQIADRLEKLGYGTTAQQLRVMAKSMKPGTATETEIFGTADGRLSEIRFKQGAEVRKIDLASDVKKSEKDHLNVVKSGGTEITMVTPDGVRTGYLAYDPKLKKPVFVSGNIRYGIGEHIITKRPDGTLEYQDIMVDPRTKQVVAGTKKSLIISEQAFRDKKGNVYAGTMITDAKTGEQLFVEARSGRMWHKTVTGDHIVEYRGYSAQGGVLASAAESLIPGAGYWVQGVVDGAGEAGQVAGSFGKARSALKSGKSPKGKEAASTSVNKPEDLLHSNPYDPNISPWKKYFEQLE